MRIPERETAVFSTSAIDLFASALGAFILLVMLLFPYYQNAGPQSSFSATRNLMEKQRQAIAQNQDQQAEQDTLQTELEDLSNLNLRNENQITQFKHQLAGLKQKIATLASVIPAPTEIVTEQEPPRAPSEGVEFSILGLASQSKSFVIVIDMSGSMLEYEQLMVRSVLEILAPLDESKQFALIGYQGNPEPQLWRYPSDLRMISATAENLREAGLFVESLGRRFVGSTPTQFALRAALDYPSSAIILMSDGAPNNPPGYILEKISALNSVRQTEIHTVAIGDYTHNRNLVMFLQALARLNNGDFVGVSP